MRSALCLRCVMIWRMSNTPTWTNPGTVTTSWRSIAIASIVVAVASLSTLTIVVTSQRVDLLTTVALTLAVIAFVAQLMIFIAQGAADATQGRENRSVLTETREALTEIKTTAKGSEDLLRHNFTRVLTHILGEDLQGSGEEGPSETIDETVERAVNTAFSRVRGESMRGVGPTSDVMDLDDETRRLFEELRSFPEDPAVLLEARESLMTISPLALIMLQRAMSMTRMDLRRGQGYQFTIAKRFPDPIVHDLIEHGLLTVLETTESGARTGRLTARGHQAARILHPTKSPPPPVVEAFYGA